MEKPRNFELLSVQLYYSKASEAAKAELEERLALFQADYPHRLDLVSVDSSPFLRKAMDGHLPRLESGHLALEGEVDSLRLASFFQEAQERSAVSGGNASEYVTTSPLTNTQKRKLMNMCYYPLLVSLIFFLYLAFAFLAPVMMKTGNTIAAQRVYAFYKPFCHQLAFRSFFLFGEQAVYPTRLAGIEGLQTYAAASGQLETDRSAAAHFVGNEAMGYKIALCQRDLAIYAGLFLVSLLFVFLRFKGSNIPWYTWLIFGLLPIAIDGFSQMLAGLNLPILNSLPPRESTPFWRVLTGLLFGGLTAWYGLFTADELILEDRLELEKRELLQRSKA